MTTETDPLGAGAETPKEPPVTADTTPTPAPTVRRRRRTATLAAIAAMLVFGAGVAVGAGLSVARSSPSPQFGVTAQPMPSATASATPPVLINRAAWDGGSVEILESGFSTFTDSSGREFVTYGLVLTNTSTTYVATDVRIEIHVGETEKRPIFDEGANKYAVWRTVGIIRPGQKSGIGAMVRGGLADWAEVHVKVHDARWLPPGHADFPAGDVAVTDVKTTRDAGRKQATLAFTVDSSYPAPVTWAPEAILRDPNGKIIGGTGPRDSAPPKDGYPAGRSTGTIGPLSFPPGVDDSRTEIHLSTRPDQDSWDAPR